MSASVCVRVAVVSLTVTATALFTDARCPPPCNRHLLWIPGEALIEVRPTTLDRASGTAPVVICKRCGTYSEIIEHG